MKELNLADILMMYVSGHADDLISIIREGSQASLDSMVDSVKGEQNNAGLYERIVDHSIENQIDSEYGFIRELIQNAIDAYNGEQDLDIDITTGKTENGDYVLSVRDYGEGMDLDSIMKNLLVVMGSSKKKKANKIGEFGQGFFSALDYAKNAEIITKKGNETTVVDVHNSPEGWIAEISTDSEEYFPKNPSGTDVSIRVDAQDFDEKKFYKWAKKLGGFVDDKFNLTFNGEKINNSKGYKKVREGDNFELYIKRKEKGRSVSNVVFTQNGLYVNEYSNPFDYGTVQSLIWEALREKGFEMRVELPKEVMLTNGRNGWIADYDDLVMGTVHDYFIDYFLSDVLEDEKLVEELDSAIGELVEKVLSKEVKERHAPKYKVEEHSIENYEQFKDLWDRIPEGKMELYLQAKGIAKSVLTKDIISALDKEGNQIKINPLELMDYYEKNQLGYIENFDNDREKEVYIYYTSKIVRSIMDTYSKINGSNNLSIKEDFIKFQIEDSIITKSYEDGFNGSVLATLEVLKELNRAVIKYASLEDVPVHMDYDNTHPDILAYTNQLAIHFNLANYTIMDIINNNSDVTSKVNNLLELLYHENAHNKIGVYDISQSHGNKFYKAKEDIRDAFYSNAMEDGYNPYKAAEEVIKEYNLSREININYLIEAIRNSEEKSQ